MDCTAIRPAVGLENLFDRMQLDRSAWDHSGRSAPDPGILMPTLAEARLWYPGDDPVHGFDHVLRVLYLAEQLAAAEGADREIVRTAVLLHDAESPETGRQPPVAGKRSSHHLDSAEFARHQLEKEGWSEDRISAVEHCIRAHRFRDEREQPQTLEARVLFDADKLDAIGAVGVARAIAYAIKHGQPAYAKPSESFIKDGIREPGEPHSAYHEFVFKLCKLKDRLSTPTAIQIAKERHRFMVDYFEQLAEEAGFQESPS